MSECIDNNELGSKGANYILDSIIDNKALTFLDLSLFLLNTIGFNNIDESSAKNISKLIKENKKISTLYLGKLRDKLRV